jgi:phosphopantothenoylcysteine decarboxylase/phosphopantothenate--cysteine ligase
MSRSLRIVVGITGGIAAYKALGVVRGFVHDGHDVHVVATDAALEFVGRSSLEALSRNSVSVGLYDDVASVKHVLLGQTADLVVVAPATANTLANIAHGFASNLLGNVILATAGQVVVAPAMHTEMWTNAATQSNVDLITSRGIVIVGPDSGALTGDDVGVGRMAEADEIVRASYAALEARGRRDLAGKRILISGGGTREPIDPVRFIGNRSSGRQAVALARAAMSRGASVTFVRGYVDVEMPVGVHVVDAHTADEMLRGMSRLAPLNDIVIMAAAVADYRVADISEEKLKKSTDGSPRLLTLEETTDVLASLARIPNRSFVLVGFAAETAQGDDLVELATSKLERKACDVLVANEVSWTKGIGMETNDVLIVTRTTGGVVDSEIVRASGDKLSVSHRILDVLV